MTLTPVAGQGPAIWARFEEHADHDTLAVELGAGRYVMRCQEHDTNHLITERDTPCT